MSNDFRLSSLQYIIGIFMPVLLFPLTRAKEAEGKIKLQIQGYNRQQHAFL
jgi:hypothetical protein